MRRLTKIERALECQKMQTLKNLSSMSGHCLSHASFAITTQDRIGHRDANDGEEIYTRVRDQHMMGVAINNWNRAIAYGLVVI